MKYAIVLAMIAILFALGSSLFFLVKDEGKGKRTVLGLTLRIGLSLGLFIFLFIAFAMGWIHPHELSAR